MYPPTLNLSATLLNRLRSPRLLNESGTVLMIDAGYLIQREVYSAFRRNEWQVVTVPLEPQEGYVERLLTALLVAKPDLLFTVNSFGFDADGIVTDLLTRIELPFVSWFVDSPPFVLFDTRCNASPYAVMPVWERAYLPFLRGLGFEHVFHLPLAGDPTVMRRNGNLRVRSSVSFVGNSMVRLAREWLDRCHQDADLAGRIENAVKALELNPDAEPVSAIQCYNDSIPNPDWSPREKLTFIFAATLEASRRYRWRSMKKVLETGVDIYGDSDWKEAIRILEDARLATGAFSSLANGMHLHAEVDYYSELSEIYRTTAVNLNITSRQMPTALNQRVFDVPLAGGFLLTDFRDDLNLLFEPDEYAVYESLEELPRKVKYYLARDSLRRTISNRAVNRILGAHTYQNRIRTVIEFVRRQFGARQSISLNLQRA